MQKQTLLSRIAYLYYIEGKSQASIAEELQLYRTSISRYLKQARDLGIVSIEIKDFNEEILGLERELKAAFGLKRVHVVDVSRGKNRAQKQELFARGGADFLKPFLKNNMTIGLVWGESIAGMVDVLESKQLHGSRILPLVGGPGHLDGHCHVNTLVYEMSKKLSAQAQFINGTIVEENAATKEAIMRSHYFQNIAQAWKELDLTITGVGRAFQESGKWQHLLTAEDKEELRISEVVGDCCGRFFDASGRVIKSQVDRRTVGIELERLKTVQSSLLFVSSKQKIRSMVSLLKGGYHNILVIDNETAKHCLSRRRDT